MYKYWLYDKHLTPEASHLCRNGDLAVIVRPLWGRGMVWCLFFYIDFIPCQEEFTFPQKTEFKTPRFWLKIFTYFQKVPPSFSSPGGMIDR